MLLSLLQAIRLTQERDLENEAHALSRLGTCEWCYSYELFLEQEGQALCLLGTCEWLRLPHCPCSCHATAAACMPNFHVLSSQSCRAGGSTTCPECVCPGMPTTDSGGGCKSHCPSVLLAAVYGGVLKDRMRARECFKEAGALIDPPLC